MKKLCGKAEYGVVWMDERRNQTIFHGEAMFRQYISGNEYLHLDVDSYGDCGGSVHTGGVPDSDADREEPSVWYNRGHLAVRGSRRSANSHQKRRTRNVPLLRPLLHRILGYNSNYSFRFTEKCYDDFGTKCDTKL